MSKRAGLAVMAAVALSLAGISGASAGVTFTWNPNAMGLGPNPDSFTANNIVVSDFANIVVDTNTGAFTETGVLVFSGFQLNGLGVNTPGFTNVTSPTGISFPYGMYVTFTASGNQGPIPTAGNATTGTITSLNYAMYGNPGGAIGISQTNTTSPVPTNNSGAISLATGSLIGTGTTTLTADSSGGLSPKADVLVSMTAAPGASSFFVAPPASALDLFLGDFSVTANVTVTQGTNTADLSIVGGGGNLLAAVPEPSSILVFASGLVIIGFVGGLRRRAA